MAVAEKKKKYTVEDYMQLEEGAPFELINNDLIRSPSRLYIHQRVLFNLSVSIVLSNVENVEQGQWLYSPMDVKFDDGNVLQPDILYISNERKSALIKDRVESAPDLVIVLLSPSNAYYDLRQKKDVYEKYGVREYIIIDPVAQNADLYALKNSIYYLHQKAELSETLNSLVLPGLNFKMDKIF